MTQKQSAMETVAESSASESDEKKEKEKEFEDQLAKLPEQYREEVLRQYDLPESKATLLSILGFATWVEIFMMVAGTILSIGAGAGMPLMVVVFGDVTNAFGSLQPDAPGIATSTTIDEFNATIASSTLDFVYIGVGVFVTTFFGSWFWTLSGERIARRIRGLYLQAVLRQNIAFFDRLGAGEVTNRISNDVELIREGISDKVSIGFFAIASFFSAFVIAFIKQWKFALILSCLVPTIMLVFGFGGVSIAKYSKLAIDEYAQASTLAEEIISSVRTAQAFGAQPKLAQLYDTSLVAAQKAGYKQQLAGAIMLSFMFGFVYAFYGLGFWQGSRMIASEDLNVGTMLTVVLAVMIGAFSLALIGPRIETFAKATAASQKIFQTLQRVPSIDSLNEDGENPEGIKGSLELNGVSFVYPARPEGSSISAKGGVDGLVIVLKNIDIAIPEGKFTAIVGPSGSGKSTILQLLERFYDPVEGTISLDGHNIRSLNVKFLRSRMGLVSQEPVLFGTSVFENVCHGMIGTSLESADERTKRDAVEKACKTANAHSFVTELPEEYNTRVGEGGFLLSGGQKQRIAIARAIVADPAILLLDEATSALDTTSERVVQEALEMASKSRTTVCIAHRLSTIKNADNIIVMSDGQIVEQGSHEELYARQGMYHGLVDAQRISAEGTGDGESTPEDVIEEEEILRRVQSSPEKDVITTTLTKTTTMQSKLSIKESNAGVVEKTHYSVLTLFKKALEFNKGEYYALWIGWFMTIITGAAYSAMALLFAYGLNYLMNRDIAFLRSRSNLIAGMWLVVAFAQFIAYALYAWNFGFASERMVRRVRLASFKAIMRQNAAFFDRDEHSTGTLTQMLGQEATAMAGLSGLNLGAILTVVFGLIIACVVALAYGWKLALVAISLLPVLVVLGFFQVKLMDHLQDHLRDAYGTSAGLVCEQIASIRTVASLRRENAILAEFQNSINVPVRRAMISTIKSTLIFAFSQAAPLFINGLLFWYGSKLLINREYTVIQVFVCLMTVTFSAQGAGQFFSFAPDVTKATSATANLARLLEHVPDIDVSSPEGKRVEHLEAGQITFKDIYFSYPTRPDLLVLRGLNFEVKAGQYVALVGASGCGKSTTVGLVERFYDPNAGQVIVDGLPVSEYNLSDYRKNISIVSQEPRLYQGTIRFNILLGLEHEVSQEEIDNACKDANIFEFIQSLPQGYETIVGTKGSALSGGQKQRIAIARALIRHPKILLLDEATSALDSEAEHLVQEAMDRAAQVKGRTTLAIAHRLSTIQKADLIYFMERGRIVERGTHEELVSRRGRYFELARQQELQRQEFDKGAET